ncbi:MAG: c-type cytochrome [Saprospiraceae bacterium]
MVFRSLICRISSLLVLLSLACFAMAQDGAAAAGGGAVDIGEGKTIFQNQCAACHNKNMKDRLTGPALGGVEERWAAYPRTDLYSWIRNSQGLIAAGHPRANELWAEWKPNLMNNFPNLTDAQIENLLAYINDVYTKPAVTGPTTADGTGTTAAPAKPNNTPLFIALALILAILAVVLARIVSSLNYILALREGNAPARRKTLLETLTSKGVIAFIIFALVVLGGYTTVNNAIALGRQQGYEPDQPIKFSHATHAGLQKIDCQYCHDSARRSKHSNIPAANTCMNCHRAIQVGSQYGTGELTKIFASIGYDPSTDKYIPNYDSLSNEQIERIYKKWIADTYVKEKGTLDRVGEKTIEDQWKGIVAALTSKETGDNRIQGPIEWTRIHNMPDHVYFNHAQHVSVGQLECQTCHGKVEEMEVVYQYSPLSMGWCINCHRQTEVQFTKNGYYDNYYEKYHKEIANGTRDKVTVENIGGLECQKCHY